MPKLLVTYDTCMERCSQGASVESGVELFVRPALQIEAPSFTFKKCCHVGMHACMSYWELGTSCVVVSPNFHAFNNQDCTD